MTDTSGSIADVVIAKVTSHDEGINAAPTWSDGPSHCRVKPSSANSTSWGVYDGPVKLNSDAAVFVVVWSINSTRQCRPRLS